MSRSCPQKHSHVPAALTPGRHNGAPRRCHRQPCLEALEGRLLFSTYTVTTLGDAAGTVTPAGAGRFNATTLRAAMTAANAHAGADTINFAAAVTGTINLGKALPRIADALTLTGPGAAKLTVQRSAAATTDFSIFHVSAGKTSTISGLKIAGGTGTPGPNEFGYSGLAGGGIYNAGTLTVTNSTLSGNSAGDGGGGIANSGVLTVRNSMLSSNWAGDSYGNGGGGILNFGTLTVTNSTLSGNYAGDGGGISNYGTLAVTHSTLSGNSAYSSGGGIRNDGWLTVTNSTLSGNSASDGGGISNAGAARGRSNGGVLTVSNSTLSGNSADIGGGISNFGAFGVSNSTLHGNRASYGGGIYDSIIPYPSEGAVSYDPSVIAHCTLSANVAAILGGGIYTASGATLLNSIVAGNRDQFGVPDNIGSAADPASAFNLIGAGKAGGLKTGVNDNRVGVTLAQLKLGPLADNGGRTKTVALLPGSIAINAGSNAGLTTDQRGAGFLRTVGGSVDIGAFEVQPVGSLSGSIFKDLNENRIQDAGEPGLKGWIVFADLNRDGKFTTGEPKAVTDDAGHYQIAGLPAGKYLVRLQPQAGWKQTHVRGDGTHGASVLAGLESRRWDFGVVPIA